MLATLLKDHFLLGLLDREASPTVKNDGRARPSPLRILRRMMLQKDIFAFAPSFGDDDGSVVWFGAKRWERLQGEPGCLGPGLG